jgi:hypothetical protein
VRRAPEVFSINAEELAALGMGGCAANQGPGGLLVDMKALLRELDASNSSIKAAGGPGRAA